MIPAESRGDGFDPARRRLFAVWALLVWIAWLFSRELLGCRALPGVAFRLLSPPWPEAGAAAGVASVALAAAGAVLLAGLGSGRALLGLASPGAGRWLELAAGLPLLALAAQALGWLGLVNGRVLAGLVALCAATALPGLERGRGAAHRSSSGPGRSAESGTPGSRPAPSAWLVWIPRIAALAVVVSAFAPEVSWDAVVYHLRVPSLYLVMHRIVPLPAIFPSYFPFTGETLFLLARGMGGDPAARVLHAAVWLAAAEGVARLAAVSWNREAAPWGRAMFVTLPFGMVIAGRAYVEFFLVLFVLGSLVSISAPRPRWLLAGWLAGAAFGTKYLGGAAALVCFGVAVRRSRSPLGEEVRLFAFAAAAAGCAWLVRNWLWTGNPVFPVLFGGPHWTPADMAGWRDDARALRPDLMVLLTAPWRLMVEAGSDGAMSPLVLTAVAGPLLWPGTRRGRLWSVAMVLWLVWWVTSPLTRYLTCALAVACAAGAGCVNGGMTGAVSRRWMTRLSLAGLAGSAACGIKSIEFSTGSFEPALGKVSPAAYREGYFRPVGYETVLAALERRSPPSGRVYMLGHVFSYDLPRRVWFEFLYARPPLYWWLDEAGGAERVRIRARQAALSQLAWCPAGGLAILGRRPWLSGWTPGKLLAWREFWAGHVRVAERIGDWVVFDVAAASPRPARGERWKGRTLPGTEAVTGPADIAWNAGRRDEAARLARDAAARYPGFPDAAARAREYGAAR